MASTRAALQRGDRGFERGRVERDLDAAVGAHPLAHREPQRARYELLGRGHAEVVAIVLEPLAHLDDVAVALGGQEAKAGALAFEERVGRDRGAVDDAVGLGEEGGGSSPSTAASAVRPSRTPTEGSSGVSRNLGQGRVSRRRRSRRDR